MSKPAYLVRCATAKGWAMAGIYAASLTATGMVATWIPKRAARYLSENSAAQVARKLERKFTGTRWEICHAA